MDIKLKPFEKNWQYRLGFVGKRKGWGLGAKKTTDKSVAATTQTLALKVKEISR